jgi:DNA-directed RNA polymerase specialized sigma54-like protein
MKLLLTSLCMSAFAVSGATFAQTEQPAPPPVEQEATQVTDADMQKFAEIYVDVETKRAEIADELNASVEPVPAEEAQVRLQEELVATVEEHGWSVDQYNQVATAISNDPEKRDKTVELINQMISG